MRSFYFAFPALLLLAGKISFAQCGNADMAAGHTATASSVQNFFGTSFPASNAFDGNSTTEWESAFTIPATPDQYIYVDLGTAYSLCSVVLTWDNAAPATNYTIDGSNDASTWSTRITVTNNATNTNTLPINGTYRYVRMHATTPTNGFNYGLFSMQVFTNTGCSSTDAALGKSTSASSSQSSFTPNLAVDGNLSTQWQSNSGNNQTLTVNLGSSQTICSVGITFGPANYATDYNIQFSPNGTTFTNAVTVTGNASAVNNFVTSGTAQYVRFNGTHAVSPSTGYVIEEITVSNPVSLPIKLADFTATNIDNKAVQLKWTTLTETNNKLFNIQRSGDGENFTNIGQVAGAINSSTALNYQWMDESPLPGKNYYRLEQVDLDGNSSYSNVNLVNIESLLTQLSAYPNPVKDVLTILNPKGVMIRDVAVFNTSGVLLSRLSPASTGTVQVSTSGWASGMYLVRVITNEGSQVLKVIK